MNLIYSYTIEDGLKDGVFIEITEKVKNYIKWRTVISMGLQAKISQQNKGVESDKIDIVFVVIATKFCIEANKNGEHDSFVKLKCKLRSDLTGEEETIFAAINVTQDNQPILTFYLPSEH